MKKRDLLALNNALNSTGELTGVKFTYAVSRNIRLITPELESLQEALKPKEEFNKFEEARMELVRKYGEKDEKGKLVEKDGKYAMADEESFDKEYAALRETHKEAIDGRQAQVDEYNKLLDEEASVELYKISLADVPKEITAAQMNAIYEIVQE